MKFKKYNEMKQEDRIEYLLLIQINKFPNSLTFWFAQFSIFLLFGLLILGFLFYFNNAGEEILDLVLVLLPSFRLLFWTFIILDILNIIFWTIRNYKIEKRFKSKVGEKEQ